MAQVNVYLNFDGNCEDAFHFYQSAFGKTISYIGKFGDMPSQEGMPSLSEEHKNRVMHVNLPISEETVLMGSDIMPGMHSIVEGNNYSVSINADSKQEATDLFNKLSDGGKVTMELQETFWGAFFGMWTDKYGIHWMVNYDDPEKNQS